MWTHEVKLEKYQATTPGGGALQLGTAESQGNEFLHVKAGEGWEGMAIKVVFRPCKVSRMVPRDGNNMVDVPWEATREPLTAAKGKIVFHGLDESGRVMNSLDLPYEVKGHSPTGDRDENQYTPGAVDQIIAETKADAEAADLSAKAAAESQKAAASSAAESLQSSKNAAESARLADASKEAATKSEKAAAGSVQSAAEILGQTQVAGQNAADNIAKAQNAAVQAVQDQQQTSVSAVQAAETTAVGQVAQASQQQVLEIEKAGAARIEAVEKAVEQAGQQAAQNIQTAQSNAVQAVGGAQSTAVQAVQDQQQTSVEAVQAAQGDAVGLVNQAGQQQIRAVKDEGSAQITAVSGEGAAQLKVVQDAGAAQVQAVNTAADTKLDQINTAIAHPPQPNTSTGFWQVWNAETGQYEDTTALYQGGYYTPSLAADGTLTWTGSQADMPALPSTNIQGPQGLGVPTPSASNIGQVPTVNNAGDGYLLTGPYAPLEASIRPTASGNPAVCSDSIAWSFQGLKIYGESTQDGTPSPESPVPIVSAGDSGSVELAVTGKNLLNIFAYPQWNNFIYNNVKLTVNPDQSINLSGTSIGNYYIYNDDEPIIFLSPGYSYKAFNNNTDLLRNRYVVGTFATLNDAINAENNIKQYLIIDDEVTTLPEGYYCRIIQMSFVGRHADMKGMTIDEKNIHLGYYVYTGTDEPWQPYTGQSLTLSTPSGLPGIPVTSGGNYTDGTGQQWICNYRDYGAGLDTIAVAKIASYNGEPITTPYMSSTGALTTGAQVLYALPQPTTQPIPAEDMAAYRALQTYAGITVVSTAEPVAGIEAQYIIDGTAAWNKINAAIAQIGAANTQTYASYEDLSGAVREGVNKTE